MISKIIQNTNDTKFLPSPSFLALLKEFLQVRLKNSWQQNGSKSDNIIFQHLANILNILYFKHTFIWKLRLKIQLLNALRQRNYTNCLGTSMYRKRQISIKWWLFISARLNLYATSFYLKMLAWDLTGTNKARLMLPCFLVNSKACTTNLHFKWIANEVDWELQLVT